MGTFIPDAFLTPFLYYPILRKGPALPVFLLAVYNKNRHVHSGTLPELRKISRPHDYTQPPPVLTALSLWPKPVSMNPNESVAITDRKNRTQSPSVVLTLPFDPKMNPRSRVDGSLNDALSRAVRRLQDAYPSDIAVPVINRLEGLACHLNYATHKRSVALFVSAETEKILYLDEVLEEQILIDSGFRIRELSIPHSSHVQYYVLLLSGHQSKMYLGDNYGLQLIKNNEFKEMGQCSRDERNEGEPCDKSCVHKQGPLDQFLYHMDEGLSVILDGHPLPVFVLATAPVAEHFARISRNDPNIGVYIHKDCLGFSEEDLLELLQPYLSEWAYIREQMALKHVAIAEGASKLEVGIDAVSKTVLAGNTRLLIVERGFTAPFPFGPMPSAMPLATYDQRLAAGDGSASSPEFFIRDRVDALIEKVLERGGGVEWVDKGALQNQAHIALVRHH
jgi:hypothetical protein